MRDNILTIGIPAITAGRVVPRTPRASLQFVSDNKVAAKSIGTEYIEGRKSLIVTLGYRSDEDSKPVGLQAVKLTGSPDMSDLSSLEAQMAEASSKLYGIICH